MIREITKDTEVLKTISTKVNPKDKKTQQLVRDLIDTATSVGKNCVSLSAIQISEPYRVIVVYDGQRYVPFINPVITRYLGTEYETEEGCLSVEGTHIVKRYTGVEIMHQKGNKFVKEKYTGFYAQIIQHEVDHLNGELITHVMEMYV